MIILGIDHGTRVMGYGVVEVVNGQPPKYVTNGYYDLEEGYPKSLLQLKQIVIELLDKYTPIAVALEGPNAVRGFMSHKALVECLGVIKSALLERKCPYLEIPPTSMKQIIAGSGYATKEEVAYSLADKLKLPFESITAIRYYKGGAKKGQIKEYILDGSDALGLALAFPIYLGRVGKLDYDER